ncbi:MAG: GvpL/GvpF family gas vesicle protein [Pseudomonadota bacterium]
MTESGLYHYAIIRQQDTADFEAKPVAGEPGGGLFVVEHGPLATVVSHTTADEILSTRRNMLAHTRALETIMAGRPILPFQFGVVAAAGEGLESLISDQSSVLLHQLDRLDGKMEVGLRVSWKRDAIMQRIVEETPSLRAARDALLGRSEAETYSQRLEIGRAVHHELSARKVRDGEAIVERLAPLAIEQKPLAEGDDITLLNMAFLLENQSEPELFKAVQAMDSEQPGLFEIKYIAPAPPFSFVSLSLGPDQAQAA